MIRFFVALIIGLSVAAAAFAHSLGTFAGSGTLLKRGDAERHALGGV
jgi:hypothetical protein